MRRLAIGAVLLAILAGPAFAQQPKADDPIVLERERQKKEREAIDRQYKSTLEKTRQTPTTTRNDPWSNIRGSDESKTKR